MLNTNECQACERIFKNYQQYLNPMLARTILNELGTQPNSLLDLGIGPGYLAAEIVAQSEHSVVGVDINPSMLDLSDTYLHSRDLRNRVDLIEADAHFLPFPDSTFGCVYSFSCFHHWAKPSLVLSECLRILKPQGKIIIWDVLPDANGQARKTIASAIPDSSCRLILEKALDEALPLEQIPNYLEGLSFRNISLDVFRFSEEEVCNSIDLLTTSGLTLDQIATAGNCWWFRGEKGGI